MSTEDEFARWLRRSEKSFLENLQFALKAWQSAELTIASKYEVVLSWLAETGVKYFKQEKDANLPAAEYTELLRLHAQPGLISSQTKRAFVEMWFQLADISLEREEGKQSTRVLPELLRGIIDFELLQDYYRSDYEAQARVYGKLLQLYELYLQQFDALGSSAFQPAQESEFFAAVMKSLKDSAKRASDQAKFDNFYCAHVLQPLVQVLLQLRTHALCFYEELLALEHLLCEQYNESALLKRVLELPLHVRLLTFECAMVNRRGVERFLQQLLQFNFRKLLETEQEQMPALELTVAAYTLEMLRKHDISLNVKMTTGETALAFLGTRIFPLVKQHMQTQLREVLMLLCAALRLNPLILEQHVFQLTAWLIVAPKSGAAEEQQLFEEYLVLLMDMFRRLSRAEKFVSNLLKSLKEWLQKNTLGPVASSGKRKAKQSACNTPSKKSKLNSNSAQILEENILYTDYLQILFKNFHKSSESMQTAVALNAEMQSFTELHAAWPSASVGLAFSKVITGLVSKPSLVIWKTLLYSLKELLAAPAADKQLRENALFQLDLNAALLCQYFAGAKLAEQYDKFSAQVLEQRCLTGEVLGAFGRFLLVHEHNERTMNAFLECCYHAASFELLLGYYRPDGLEDDSLGAALVAQLHGFLSEEEWALVRSRVLQFGKCYSKFLLNRLQLQRKQARLLLLPQATFGSGNSAQVDLEETFDCAVASDAAQLQPLLQLAPNAKWLNSQLKHADKLAMARTLHNKVQLFAAFEEDLESVELLALCAYESLCKAFAANSKTSLMGSLQQHFDAILAPRAADSTLEHHMQSLVQAINAHLDDYSLNKLPTTAAEQALRTLSYLPIAHLRRQCKIILFALHLAFYRDLKAAEAHELATKAFELFTDFLHFGAKLPIFKYFSTASILKLFPVEQCWEFYEFIFASIKNEDKSSERFLLSLIEILQQAQDAGKLNEQQLRLTLIGIETLSSLTGPSAKRMRKYLESILEIYAAYVAPHFAKTQGEVVKKDKKFVEKTLAGFAPYASVALSQALTDATASTQQADAAPTKPQFPVDEQFRRICKVYIGHSMDYRNPHAIRLMQVALNHRQQLHLDQDEIEFVLSGYWRQLNADLRSAPQEQQPELNAKTTEAVVKMMIGNKTNEDMLLTLKDIAANLAAADEKSYLNVTRLLALIAKCPFSTIKGAIFNEQFKQLTYDIILRLPKDERQQFVNTEQVLNILACQLPIVQNKMIPISLDTLDSILCFLVDINIKKFLLSDTNVSSFYALHLAMTELCTALIKQRHVLLMDRVPQFMHIFKDLLQAVIWYKSERQKDTALTPTELDNLAELALKLEALMHIVATHSVGVKRVAPFVLTFVIHLMVANKRPTTLYPKIKTHIESICYDLVGICDHRVGGFILRCSNEAARQVYEILVKDHKKYHKFKGKV